MENTAGTPAAAEGRAPEIVVCPNCHYGFPHADAKEGVYACPRRECAHTWAAFSETMAAVHGVTRRKPNPELHVVSGATPAKLALQPGETHIGRDPQCQLVLDNQNVSRKHARIHWKGDEFWIEDLGSMRGTGVNGAMISRRTALAPADELLIGGVVVQFAVRYEAEPGPQLADNMLWIARDVRTTQDVRTITASVIPLPRGRLTFGRAGDRDVVLPNVMISRRHALVEHHDGRYFLSDTQSQYGTFVNGKSIIRQALEPGDRIQLGPYLFRFEGSHLLRIMQLTSLAVVAIRLCQLVGKAQQLDDVSLVFRPGEFIGVLGPSGAGKTTLLDALAGLRPARSGQVYINGDSLYDNYRRLRHLIGYVPQEDIIHEQLTCRQALGYVGRLRLPPDLSETELVRHVEETLEALDLVAQADSPIGHLSGGQRKRASVAVELLSKPGILFLDEPSSDLDPSAESRLMQKLKRLAEQGRTVVCTTHVMENVDLFDKIAVLAAGGRLVYFGPPVAARDFFQAERFTGIYDRLEEKPPETWQQRYRQSDQYRQLLVPILGEAAQVGETPAQRVPPAGSPSVPGQGLVLARRFSRILFSDWQNPALLLAQPLITAALLCLVFNDVRLILFFIAISALWFGCGNAVQQLVKERPLYRRERMVNLRLGSYLLSKLLVLGAVGLLQGAGMLTFAALVESYDGRFLNDLAVIALASWNGAALGLIISALAPNTEKAAFAVPIVLVPQVLLGGGLAPVSAMNAVAQIASCAVATRWANDALQPGISHPAWLIHLLILIGFLVVQLVGLIVILKRQDALEIRP